MRNKYSYIFGGHAIAAEIQKPEPDCGILGATALPITGGCARADVGQTTWRIPDVSGVNSFESGSSFVSGRFTTEDTKVCARSVTAAYLNTISLLDGLVTIEALAANLVTQADDDDAPKFSFGATNPITQDAEEKIPIKGLFVNRKPVDVELDREALALPFERLREKFDPLVRGSILKLSFQGSDRSGDCSIEDGHIIRISDVRIHFGELLFGQNYRNLTLFRITVGEDEKSRDCGPNVASGPSGYPP